MPPTAFRSTALRLLKRAAIVLVVVLLLPYLLAPLYRLVEPVSTLMLWRRMTFARVERTWTPLATISPALPRAVMVAEDARFCTHRGVDFGELRNAIADADDLSEMRGGSTIAQQTAKNLFLWPGRSVVRKALEFPLALWLDLVLGKRRLMEIYLNIAQWGPNGEFGAEAGARHAFNKPARDLRPARPRCSPRSCPTRSAAAPPSLGGGAAPGRDLRGAGAPVRLVADCIRAPVSVAMSTIASGLSSTASESPSASTSRPSASVFWISAVFPLRNVSTSPSLVAHHRSCCRCTSGSR